MKYICLCCFGQLRNGRFMMNNHKHYLIDYFYNLGYKIHIYFHFDLTETNRVYVDVNTKHTELIVYPIRDKNDILIYVNTLISSKVEYYELVIDDSEKQKDEILNTYYLEQYKKYYNILKQIKTEIIYDIIIRYRVDNFFLNYPNIPNDNEVIQPKFITQDDNYIIDSIQIFKGKYLNCLIKNFEKMGINTTKLNDDFNSFVIFPEHFSIELFKKTNLNFILQYDFFNFFRLNYIRYFKFICWEYYNDYISIECPPYNIDKIHLLRNLINEKNNDNEIIILNLDKKDDDSLYFYDFVLSGEPIYYQELMISAFTPDKIICNNSNYLYNFINIEFSDKMLI